MLPLLLLASALVVPSAAVTIYTTLTVDANGNPTPTSAVTGPAYTGLPGARLLALVSAFSSLNACIAAYNLTTLVPPALPSPLPPTAFNVQLSNGPTANMSIKVKGNFMGMSIELSVANQIRTCPLILIVRLHI